MKKGVDYTGVCVVFYCHDGQGNVLMHKRSNKCRDEFGCWDIGGGGFEFGEQVLEAVGREIFEEYGVCSLEIEHLGYRDVHREHDGKPTHWVALDFKVRIDPSQVINGEPEKIEELGWFTMDSIPDPIHSQLGTFFDNYKHKL
ncbi:NUDIX domain-containing protein [Patescibacteria group bacterium]|nr:NUDIX domain-containing protein [Patescibacteria group bacterium]MBU4452938.1 NUDIX domain-containing protein [Patescibacteria group bacterium]MCG2687925.1 NUDIX domain-containing protein [Candidatus Parcubacteria bacterium]